MVVKFVKNVAELFIEEKCKGQTTLPNLLPVVELALENMLTRNCVQV